jgi:hypothetical protein
MSKSQNRNKGNKRCQGNMNPQKVNNLKLEDWLKSEEDESSHSSIEVRRMMIRMFNGLKRSLKRTYKNNSVNLKRTWITNLRRLRNN